MTTSERETLDINLNLNRVGNSIRESGILAAGAFAACVSLAFFASTQITPTYTADARLLFTKVDRTAALTGLGSGESGQLQSLLIDQTPLTTQIEVLRSRPLLQTTIEMLDLRDEDGELLHPDVIDQNLDVSIIGGTDIVEVLYTDADPARSALIVNTLIEQYRENSIITNRNEATEAKEFLLAQLPQTESTVRQAEADLRSFLEQNQIGILDEEARSLVARIETVSNQIATVQASLEGTATQSATLQDRLNLTPQEALIVGNLSQNPGIQEAILSLQAVERDLAAQQARFNDSSPVVRQLLAQQQSLNAFLQEQIRLAGGAPNVPDILVQGTPNQQNITQALIQTFLDTEVEYVGLQQQLNVLREYQNQYQSRLASVPSLSAEQRALERRVAVAEETYSNLLSRLQELQVQENETTYNTRIIQPAFPPAEPDSGGQIKILALGVMGGSLLAIAIVLISEALRPSSFFREAISKKKIGEVNALEAMTPNGK